MPNKYGILDSLVGSTDFLCQQSPLVCVERLTVNPTNRRTGAFLLEDKIERLNPRLDPSRSKTHKKMIFKHGQWRSQYACNCFKCGIDFNALEKATFCSRQCFFEHNRGKNNASWKGGRAKISNGYIGIYSPNHPNKDQLGYVREHRLLMEEKIGRYLRPEEVVHHINGIKTDNRIENLLLFENQGEHQHNHGNITR